MSKQLTMSDVKQAMLTRLKEMEEKKQTPNNKEKNKQKEVSYCSDGDRYVCINGARYIDHGW